MLTITAQVRDALITHARHEAPLEACGYIGVKDTIGVDVIRLRNVDRSPEHFSFDPAEQFAAVRALRANGLKPSVVYHSHPATPARPSKEDNRLSRDPDVTYLIVSLAEEEPDIKAFTINGDELVPEEFHVTTH